MRYFAHICCFVAFVLQGMSAAAQNQTVIVPSPIMVVDFERVFSETQYGQRIAIFVSSERERVQADNDRIAAELLAEETALTNARDSMDRDAFRDAARLFDERAQAVRSGREAEQVRLLELRDRERAQFLERIRPIVLALMLERGAVVAMDRRAVIQAIGGANATADAVLLIDETLGDGTRDPSERPASRPMVPSAMPLVAPITADDVPETPSPDDDLPQAQ